jgi:hypothetical protein
MFSLIHGIRYLFPFILIKRASLILPHRVMKKFIYYQKKPITKNSLTFRWFRKTIPHQKTDHLLSRVNHL